ncbi:MAG: helix-turn-helix domain-containing protein [Chlorobi bacterium]|nr:helix-turn-helix domain-containing protein [Chlorobiota bacterium]
MKVFLPYGVLILSLSISSFGQTNEKILQIPYSSKNITVDGDLSDWDEYFEYEFSDTLHSFINTSHQKLSDLYPANFDFDKLLFPKSKNKAKFRAFWNNENFCCAVTGWDKHFFAENHGRIDKPMVHLNDGIELYIDTKGEGTPKMDVNDYQFLIDIRNNAEVFKGDLKEILADTVAVPKDYAQNILFFSAVKINGTLNDNAEDSVYTIEIVIPFAAIGVAPKSNMIMRLDVCVNDIDYPLSQTGRIEEASTAMWPFSWSGYSDFGYPKYWKQVQFIGAPSWFEAISEKYKAEWFWIYLITASLALVIIVLLIYRTYKLRRLPSADKINYEKLSVHPSAESLSYNEKILQKAAEYIVANKSETIHSDELTRNLGVSLRTFQRITRDELNITPTNFVYVIKLKLAADFLKNKKGNVTDAAYEFGFSDPSYFSKTFKKHFEISPTDFIKKRS